MLDPTGMTVSGGTVASRLPEHADSASKIARMLDVRHHDDFMLMPFFTIEACRRGVRATAIDQSR
jgi:hypothetical protein